MENQKETWRLSKEIPISVILVLIVYALTAVWQVAHINSRLALTSETANNLEIELSEQYKDMLQLDARLVKIEEDVLYIRRSLDLLLAQTDQN